MIFDSLHHKSRVWLYISSIPIKFYTKDKISSLFNDLMIHGNLMEKK